MTSLCKFLIILIFTGLSSSCISIKPELPEQEPVIVSEPKPAAVSDTISDIDTIAESDETLPGPEDNEIPGDTSGTPAEEEIKPLILELSEKEINRQIMTLSGDSFYPVHNEGKIIVQYTDIDQNGYEDAFILTVGTTESEKASFSYLSDFSRLYNDEEEKLDLYLSAFFQINGKLISMYRIPIGRKTVLDGFDSFYINEKDKTGFTFTVSFHTEKGSEHKFITFSTYNKFSFFDIKETITKSIIIEDINDDNFIDIVSQEQILEEGTGYETFFTLYEWNGESFEEANTAIIVRRLKKFLTTISEYLMSANWEGFSNHAISSESLLSVVSQGLSYYDLFKLIFHLESEEENTYPDKDERILSVIFPEIFENPFIRTDEEIYYYPLSVRLLYPGNKSRLYRSELRMNNNFFSSPQFYFFFDLD